MAWLHKWRSGRRAQGPGTVRELNAYAHQYSDERFWNKIHQVCRRVGYELLEKALWLYFAARRPETPDWAKATAYGALAYFILPFDAIPDFVFGYGYTDDLGALTLAVITISRYIDGGVRRRTTAQLDKWFSRPSQRAAGHAAR